MAFPPKPDCRGKLSPCGWVKTSPRLLTSGRTDPLADQNRRSLRRLLGHRDRWSDCRAGRTLPSHKRHFLPPLLSPSSERTKTRSQVIERSFPSARYVSPRATAGFWWHRWRLVAAGRRHKGRQRGQTTQEGVLSHIWPAAFMVIGLQGLFRLFWFWPGWCECSVGPAASQRTGFTFKGLSGAEQ